MRNDSMIRKTLTLIASALLLVFVCGSATASAQPRANASAKKTAVNPVVPPGAHIDAADVTYKWPSQIQWRGRPGGPQFATLEGDQKKPGFYVVLLKLPPHVLTHPHYHTYDRYVTVLSGTWWVGTGRKFQPGKMVPMPAGSFVTDLAGQVHYDGSKDGPVIIEICGRGPVTMTPAETK